MTLRRSWRSQEYITGRCPLGAQVRRTKGWSIRPVSSRNSMIFPVSSGFFLCAASPLSATGRRPFHHARAPGSRASGNSSPRPTRSARPGWDRRSHQGLGDHFGDPVQGPKFGLVPKMGRSFQEQLAEPLALGQIEFERASRHRLGRQRLHAALFQTSSSSVPPIPARPSTPWPQRRSSCPVSTSPRVPATLLQ